MASVYVLSSASSPSDIRYVGVTKYDSPERRLQAHLGIARRGTNMKAVHCWIQKLIERGEDVVCTTWNTYVEWQDALSAEVYLISRLKAEGHDLLNLTLGGEGSLGVAQSDATKAKRSASLSGRKVSEETKKRISTANTGKVRSEESRKKMREAKVGVRLSEEHKKKIGQSLKGRPVSAETRKKLSDTQKGKKLSSEHVENLRQAQARRRDREKSEKMSGDKY